MAGPDIRSVHALLLLGEDFVLQHRDDKPGILAPGLWTLFGGIKDQGESPLEAIRREIREELSVQPAEFAPLWRIRYRYPERGVLVESWIFSADLAQVWGRHRLNEGQGLGVYSYAQAMDLDMVPVMRLVLEKFHTGRVSLPDAVEFMSSME